MKSKVADEGTKMTNSSEASSSLSAVQDFGKIPMDVDDIEYCGWEMESVLRCRCGLIPVRRVAFEGCFTGRRFISCCNEDETRCDFISCYDPEWPPTMERALEKLWGMGEAKEKQVHAELNSLMNKMLEDKLTAEKVKLDTQFLKMEAEKEKAFQKLPEMQQWILIALSCNVTLVAVLPYVIALNIIM
ncbi:uncharacterized protein LOC106866114 [Brachypodium distachyon]|uniref:Zinc finger GRF-type domain-containing protein n=1 Tax=Brachypodium distachyon TaxID=15368 RepID=A0A0Q3G4G3_BRADI|nr:uncharacterized protein LOC106866114 [Brachypodium distachyon]KQK06200.1 hypothetical protein BRADI_2g25076v3 [Brachypodium distachyon]|eukprot:XP_014754329.1 uncharacterized protein LOC106866114 [Brachypodium distachyon]